MLNDRRLEVLMSTPRWFGALLFAVVMPTLACTDDHKRSPLAPATAYDPGRAPFAGVAGSSIVSPQPVANSFCPGVPPFIAPFDFSVQTRDEDFFLDHVQGGFVDVFGITAPTITLSQPQLLASFGSTRIPAASSRTFPMQFPFGCGTVGAGTLTLVFVMRDQHGTSHTSRAVVTVR
jgi:hypothetical protein